RIVQRQDRHRGAEQDFFGLPGKRREKHERRGQGAIFVEVMLGEERRVVAELLRQHGLLDRFLVELLNGARTGGVMVEYGKQCVFHLVPAAALVRFPGGAETTAASYF